MNKERYKKRKISQESKGAEDTYIKKSLEPPHLIKWDTLCPTQGPQVVGTGDKTLIYSLIPCILVQGCILQKGEILFQKIVQMYL